ncbi:hypothetical protein [Mycobacterium kyorinense]|uniref:hypothetical protein n=1 Tax=Mycobacterium kyorinense TaxID=487514 RepID=UPI000A4788ED|nr:hypothetical protein [Mycobacterium kyorinense]
MTADDIVRELRDCADLLETVTKQPATTAHSEPLGAHDAHRIVTALQIAADLIER